MDIETGKQVLFITCIGLGGSETAKLIPVTILGDNKSIAGGIYIRYPHGGTDTTFAKFLFDIPAELQERLRAAEAERDRYKFVPGVMRCAKCEFQLIKSNLNIAARTVTAGSSDTEPCPNGCGPLWRVSWSDYAKDHADAAEKYFLEAKELRSRIEAAEKQEPVVIFKGIRHNSKIEMWGVITEHAELIPPNAPLYALPPMPEQQDEPIKGENYEAGLWSDRNYEAWREDQSKGATK